jgi:hypothetical protein
MKIGTGLSYLVIKEIKQVFDCEGQSGTPVRRTEDRLEEVVHELLERSLRGQQPRQVDLRDHLAVSLTLLIIVPLVSHKMPEN